MAAVASRYARAFADVVLDGKLDPKQVTEQLAQWSSFPVQSRSSPGVGEPGDTCRAEAKAAGRDRRTKRNVASGAELYGRADRSRADLRGRTDCPAVPDGVELIGSESSRRRSPARVRCTEAESRELLAEVSRVTGKQVSAQYKIDPSMIGGAAIRVGSTVYDGSVRGQLQKMKEQLSAE